MIPCAFGPSGRQRLAIYHAPRPSAARDQAVLLCPPLGQEYMRSHQALRRLALALNGAGLHVLRFDWAGMGDSAGEVHAGSVAEWLDDVGLAASELLDLSGASQLALCGLRAGALLAAAACARGAPAAGHLLLWDAVTDGAAWVAGQQALHEAHVASVRQERPVPTDELLGAPLPAAVRAALAQLRLESLAGQLQAPRVDVLASTPGPQSQQLRAMLDAAGHAGRLRQVNDPAQWDDHVVAFDMLLAGPCVQAACGLLAGQEA